MYNGTFVNFQQTTILWTLTISLLITYLVKLSIYDGSNITFIGIYHYNYLFLFFWLNKESIKTNPRRSGFQQLQRFQIWQLH